MGQSKDVLIATRVTSRIKEIVDFQASREGLYVSEWVRMLIIKELNSRNLLSGKIIINPDLDK